MILSISVIFWTIIVIVVIFIFTLLIYQMVQRARHYPFTDNYDENDTLDEQIIEKILEPNKKYYKLLYNDHNDNFNSSNSSDDTNAIVKTINIVDDDDDDDGGGGGDVSATIAYGINSSNTKEITNLQLDRVLKDLNGIEMNQKHVQKLNTIPDDYGFFDDDFKTIEY
ncbi:putative protein 3 [Mauternbach virus]|uniref:Uncharacterized protein n=1 Tax=Mauternbach virus TaxID=2486603 RepID=A0A3G3E7A2_9VIRU|nr:putative protein 3 [Mauternbach virus]AYP97971.1 putative protein 3 [Mauternbach virus]